jgi:hypothetical protein
VLDPSRTASSVTVCVVVCATPCAAISTAVVHDSSMAEAIAPTARTSLLIPYILRCVGWRRKVRTPAPLANGASMTACKDLSNLREFSFHALR